MAGSLTVLGSGIGNGSAVNLTATGITASVGDILVAAGGCFLATTHTFTDTAGNAWTTQVTGNQRCALATCRVTSALSSATVTDTYGLPNSSQVARTMIIANATGILSSGEFDTSASSAAGGSVAAWNSGNLGALGQANELLIAASCCDTAAGTTSNPDAGWTEPASADITNGGGFQLVLQYKSVSSSASGQNGGGTWGSSGWAWNAAIIALKETTAGTTGIVVPGLRRYNGLRFRR